MASYFDAVCAAYLCQDVSAGTGLNLIAVIIILSHTNMCSCVGLFHEKYFRPHLLWGDVHAVLLVVQTIAVLGKRAVHVLRGARCTIQNTVYGELHAHHFSLYRHLQT